MKDELIKPNAGGQDIVHVGGHGYVNLKLHSWPIGFHFLHTRSRQMLVNCKVFLILVLHRR